MTKKLPHYRFQGYTDAWELRKLGEAAPLRGGFAFKSSDFVKEGIPIVRISNILSNGRVGAEFLHYKELEQDERFTLHDGAAVLAMSGATTGKVSVLHVDEGEKYYQNQRVGYFTPTPGYNYDFIKVIVNSTFFTTQRSSVLVAGAQPNISSKEVDDFCFAFPKSLPEQSAIGTFFSTLDRHITLHQRKLDTLKEQKKTYLKLLFPAKGQTKPALRFQGFEDDWKEVKLGELCDIRTGKLDANAMVENGEYDFYTSGIKKYRIDVAEFEGPAITIAGNGATVGYMHLADGKFNAYQRTYVLTNFKVDRRYIFSEIAKKLPIKIQQEARTGNIPYIVLSMLTELSISLPSLPEQKAIGTFFQTLDQEIAQVEDKLASLKEMKKTLLRKLFV